MCKVSDFYRVDRVDDAEVETLEDGRWGVTLGDGELALPENAEVQRLCRRMHRAVSPVSPLQVYEYVCTEPEDLLATDGVDGSVEHVVDEGGAAAGAAGAAASAASAAASAASAAGLVTGGRDDDPRLMHVKIAEVPARVVCFYWPLAEGPTMGHARCTLKFEQRAHAKLALAVDRHHRKATAADVLRCLSRALDEGERVACGVIATHVLPVPLPPPLSPPLGARASDAAEARCGLMRSRAWTRFVEGACKRDDFHEATRWAVYVSECRAVAEAVLVHHHWHVSPSMRTTAEHRTRFECRLTFFPGACGGPGVAVLTCEHLHEDWPWWLARDLHVVDGLADAVAARGYAHYGANRTTLGKPRCAKRVLEEDAAASGPTCGGRSGAREGGATTPLETTLWRWRKSHERCVSAPRLTSVLPLNLEADGHGVAASSGLCMRRVRAGDASAYKQAQAVLRARFTKKYADATLARCLRDESEGLYLVHDGDGASASPIGVAAVVLYGCEPCGRRPTVALMIDTFAIERKFEGSGRGGALFRELLLPLAARRAGREPFYVFAQCVETGGARLFWMDRLDETPVARSLMMQAYLLESERVEVHLFGDCAPRVREYGGCDAGA